MYIYNTQCILSIAFDFVAFLGQFCKDDICFHLFDKQPLLLKYVKIGIHLLRLSKINKISSCISKTNGLLQKLLLVHDV